MFWAGAHKYFCTCIIIDGMSQRSKHILNLHMCVYVCARTRMHGCVVGSGVREKVG
jgi:hypothetical protein